MSNKLFGAIYIGSYEVSLKIFEFSQKKKMREIDNVRSRIDLGKDAYNKGILGYELVEQLCDTLCQFKTIMTGYKVNDYEIYASAVLRDIENELFVLDQIYLITGLNVKVITNSEIRFLSYKSVAGRDSFDDFIKTSAAIVDIGGANIQITYFKNGELVTTQHIETGTMRISSLLYDNGNTEKTYRNIIQEYLIKKFNVLKNLYMQDGVECVVFLNDYGMDLVNHIGKEPNTDNRIKSKKMVKYLDELLKLSLTDITKNLNMSNDTDSLIIPNIMIYKTIINLFEPNEIWIPGANINDGIAYDYAQKNNQIKILHDFDEDIISASKQLSKHYNSYSMHIDMLVALSKKIYKSTKKLHGLGKREELLLEVAAMLHDCGKYISLTSGPESAYHIIMSSEIIGLTHAERQIVAYTVLFNALPLVDYDEISDQLDRESFLTVAKLSAILRVANALDQSHRQKFENTRITIKGREIIFTVESLEDISLEQILFEKKTAYFEKIFSVKPVLKEKKSY